MSAETESIKKLLYRSMIQTSWSKAKLMCEMFGMELLTPESETEDKFKKSTLSELLEVSYWDSIFVGAVSIGKTGNWYSAMDGKILKFDLDWDNSEPNDPFSATPSVCLQLKQKSGNCSYASTDCVMSSHDFICQKIVSSNEG